jgi:hypothetical protein
MRSRLHSQGLKKGQCMQWALKDCIIARVRQPNPSTNTQEEVIAGTPAPLPRRTPGLYRPHRLQHPDEASWTSAKEAELDGILCCWA